MPPLTQSATAINQDQTRPHRGSERKNENRAASVPVSGRENPWLKSLRLKKQKPPLLDAEGTPPSSVRSSVTGGDGRHSLVSGSARPFIAARGRKRNLLPPAASQGNFVASTSDLAAGPTPNTSEQRPRKRQKRSSSTPPAPRSCQLSTQLQSRRRTRSRVGSPTTDGVHAAPSRVSARLACKSHPLLSGHNSDIYTHLADPDSAGNLLSEPPTGSIMLSAPNKIVSSQSVRKPRGRRKPTIDLGDENVKKDLIEEWVHLRQSQGTLPLSGIDKNACTSLMLRRDTQKGDESASSAQFEAVTQKNTPDLDPMENRAPTVASTLQAQETAPDVFHEASFVRMDFKDVLPTGMDASENNLDVMDSASSPGGAIKQPVFSSVDAEAPAPVLPRVGEDSPNGVLADVPETLHYHDASQRLDSSANNSLTLPINAPMQAASHDDPLKDGHSATSQMYSSNSSHIQLDSDEEFNMLDVPDVFALPWVPVASHLYVPPGLGKLISGMKEQLTLAARARRRAEELYQAELNRRILAEKIVENLRMELEERQKDSSERVTC